MAVQCEINTGELEIQSLFHDFGTHNIKDCYNVAHINVE